MATTQSFTPEGIEIYTDFCRKEIRSARLGSVTTKYTIERPAELTDHAPTIIVPGHLGFEPFYNRLRTALATEQDRSAISMDYPTLTVCAWVAAHRINPDVPHSKGLKAVLRDVYDEGQETVSLVAHSKGGKTVTDLVEHLWQKDWRNEPGQDGLPHIDSVVFLASAGLEAHNLNTFAGRAMPVALALASDVVHYPKLRDIANARALARQVPSVSLLCLQGLAASSCDILPGVRHLKELDVPMTSIGLAKDVVLPAELARARAGEDLATEIIPGGHWRPVTHPQETAAFLATKLP